jgi:hypothetical protein
MRSIDEIPANQEPAFDQIFIAGRQLAERRNRRRALAQRPQEYCLARRLLASGASAEPPDDARARPAARRLARAETLP